MKEKYNKSKAHPNNANLETLAIEEAIKEADKGVFISSKKMRAWFVSLGTENELPKPEPDVFLKK